MNYIYNTFPNQEGVVYFYTDIHNVDEDLMAASIHGGKWPDSENAGIASRYMDYSLTSTLTVVASLKNKD